MIRDHHLTAHKIVKQVRTLRLRLSCCGALEKGDINPRVNISQLPKHSNVEFI
jgi:hypothetical protein